MSHQANESANKNFHIFLYKIFREWYPFQAEEWDNANRILRKEILANGKRYFNWKHIINHLLRESIIRGPSSNQWQTLMCQLDVLQNIENYIRSPSGQEIIKWRHQQSRSLFISISAEKAFAVESLLRLGIEEYPSFYSQQLLDDIESSANVFPFQNSNLIETNQDMDNLLENEEI